MTVYFISRIDDHSLIKVGHTENLERRMLALGSQIDDGVILHAQCAGGKEVEAFLHATLAPEWVEGEWFRRSPTLDRIIETFASEVAGRRVWGRLRAVEGQELSAADIDRETARKLLEKVMGRLGPKPYGVALSLVYKVLNGINPMWSRRRVSALWAREASRIDHFEIRDLEAALALRDEDFNSNAGGVDRAGTEG